VPQSAQSLAAAIAANSRWSREDPAEQGRVMRAGLERRFLDQVDPNRELPEAERLRRVECAKRAYYQRLALASAKARKARREARTQGGDPNVAA
jgi:hypothetical protein